LGEEQAEKRPGKSKADSKVSNELDVLDRETQGRGSAKCQPENCQGKGACVQLEPINGVIPERAVAPVHHTPRSRPRDVEAHDLGQLYANYLLFVSAPQ
jgi:hypothetical protein